MEELEKVINELNSYHDECSDALNASNEDDENFNYLLGLETASKIALEKAMNVKNQLADEIFKSILGGK